MHEIEHDLLFTFQNYCEFPELVKTHRIREIEKNTKIPLLFSAFLFYPAYFFSVSVLTGLSVFLFDNFTYYSYLECTWCYTIRLVLLLVTR